MTAVSIQTDTSMPSVLTVPEACEVLRISRWMLYRLIQQRNLSTVKIGSRRLIPASAIRAFLDQALAEEQSI